MKVLYDIDTLPHGKHAGKTVAEVIEVDPNYIKMFNNLNIYNPKSWASQYAISDITLKSIRRF